MEEFLEERLVPLNAWIALLTGGGGWPAPLRDNGFDLHRLEAPVSTSAKNVVLDGLAIAEQEKIILPTEAKSGDNVDEAQARKYQAMLPFDVRRQHTLPFSPENARVEPLYVCLEKKYPRIRKGLEVAGVDFSVLIIGSDMATLIPAGGSGLLPFRVSIPVEPPPAMVPIDAESSDTEFREFLLPEVIAAAARRIHVVPVATLLDKILPYWGVYTGAVQHQLLKRAANVLRELAKADYKAVFRVEAGGASVRGNVVRILQSPTSFDPRGETQGWQRLKRKGERALRGKAAPVIGEQLSFEDLAREAEKGEK